MLRASPSKPYVGTAAARCFAAACSTAALAKPPAAEQAPLAMHVAATPAMCGDATAAYARQAGQEAQALHQKTASM